MTAENLVAVVDELLSLHIVITSHCYHFTFSAKQVPCFSVRQSQSLHSHLWDRGSDVTRIGLLTYLGVKFDRSLWFKARVDLVIMKACKGLSAMRVMAGASIEPRPLVLLCQGLVVLPVEQDLATLFWPPSLSARHGSKDWKRCKVKPCASSWGCTRAMRLRWDFPPPWRTESRSGGHAYTSG